MRTLSPILIATSVALALGSGSALAATGAGTTPAATSTTTATTSTATLGTTASSPSTPSSSSSSSGGTGIAITNAGSDTTNAPSPETAATGTALGTGVLVPGVVTTTEPAVNANGERIVPAPTAAANQPAAPTPTPLFELTARQGMAKEARRKARGEEPRVYGIAPRTERDLTHQMPDDPIIRY